MSTKLIPARRKPKGQLREKTPEPAADNSQDGATPNLVVQHHGSGARGQAATAESPRSPNHPFQKLLKVLLWSGIFCRYRCYFCSGWGRGSPDGSPA